MRLINFFPGLIFQKLVDSCQIKLSFFQTKHRFNQFFHQRKGSRRSGCDNSFDRRILPPQINLRPQQTVTPVTGVNQLPFGQNLRPIFGNNLQKFERFLPMNGIFFRHQICQPVKRKALIVNRINQISQFLRQIAGLIRRQFFNTVLYRFGHNDFGEQQQPLRPADSRCQRCQSGRLVKSGQKQLVFFHVADRQHLRQQCRRQPLQTHKSVFQRLNRPAVRQQKKNIRQLQFPAVVLSQKMPGQNFGKGTTRRNIVNFISHG